VIIGIIAILLAFIFQFLPLQAIGQLTKLWWLY